MGWEQNKAKRLHHVRSHSSFFSHFVLFFYTYDTMDLKTVNLDFKFYQSHAHSSEQPAVCSFCFRFLLFFFLFMVWLVLSSSRTRYAIHSISLALFTLMKLGLEFWCTLMFHGLGPQNFHLSRRYVG